jgi:hypothetical protein
MKKIIVLLVILISSIFVSCESNTYGEISFVAHPTFNANIGPIVKSSCAGCHNASSGLNVYETYDQIKNGMENGDIICRIDQLQSCGKVMPQTGAMPRTTIDMFILWQNQGYAN